MDHDQMQRSKQRYELKLEVDLDLQPMTLSPKEPCYTHNVSYKGMFISCSGKIPDPGDMVSFKILRPFEPHLEGKGIVRWCNKEGNQVRDRGVGLEILDFISPYHQGYYEQLISLLEEDMKN
ncbi:MAG: PilZ domain-containing protein [Oligoflexales bacterium]|nr:PilZ domain-containing protein [Oligoflexales bacterium]